MDNKKLIIKFIIVLFVVISVPLFTSASFHEATLNVSISATVGGPVDEDCNGCKSGSFTGIIFSGHAYPGATVHIWKNGIPKTTTLADNMGRFRTTITEIYSPNVLYTLYAIDKEGRRSTLLNYPVVIKIGYVTHISGILFAPTIGSDKVEVKAGGNITISGYALPSVPLDLVLGGLQSRIFKITSNSDGTYKITIPLNGFRNGEYKVHTKYVDDNRISKVIQFTIGNIDILSVDLTTNIPGDCNADQVINLIDFSVMAFWYRKDNPPRCIDTNKDNVINLVDFSILAFYWTG